MKKGLPTPSNILEELADKVIVGIDSLAITTFKSALDEMTRYHRFLLDAYATKSDDGTAFNYAEVQGDWIGTPHQDWVREYGRVFDRAIDLLGKETEFVHSLAHMPIRLLSKRTETLSPTIISSILDLGSILVSRLEQWVTRRVTVDNLPGQSASPRLALVGSDKLAYSEVALEVVGAWEGVLQLIGPFYGWKQARNLDAGGQWRALSKSWLFLRSHLRNTAYFVAAAVWNEDDIGAYRFGEALVRWPKVFEFELPDQHYSRYDFLLLPDLFSLDWDTAKDRVKTIESDDLAGDGIDPFALAATLFDRSHSDAILLTTSVMLRWHIGEKQSSDIAIRTAVRMLRRELIEDETGPPQGVLRFSSLFFSILRLDIAGERHDDKSYGGFLDGLASYLDQMSERRVVPGRIFTPSTVHSRHDLLLPFLCILLVYLPAEGDDNIVTHVDKLATDVFRFPQTDRSLRNTIQLLRELSDLLKTENVGFQRTVTAMSPKIDFVESISRLEEMLRKSVVAIEKHRASRIRTLSIDPSHLERIQRLTEVALLTPPAGIEIFRNFQIRRADLRSQADASQTRIRHLPKGALTSPPMDSSWAQLDESIVRRFQSWAAEKVWRSFATRSRQIVSIGADPRQRDFWTAIALCAGGLGPMAILLLEREAIHRLLIRWTHSNGNKPEGLRLEQKAAGQRSAGRYICSIEGVDVYHGGLKSGNPLLFSGTSLKQISYEAVSANGSVLDVGWEAEDDPWKITLCGRIAQFAVWDDSPIVEFQISSDEPIVSNPDDYV